MCRPRPFLSGTYHGYSRCFNPAGTRVHPTGLRIVNLRPREMLIAGQTRSGSGLWHVHGSPDGRWAVGDDFARNLGMHCSETSKMRIAAQSFMAEGSRLAGSSLSMEHNNVQIEMVAKQ